MKLASLALPVAVVAVAATIFASEYIVRPKTHEGRVIINYWEKWTGVEADAMRAVVDEFNRRQSRIWVNYVSMSGVNQKTMLATSGGVPPDVAGVWFTDVAPFADNKAALPLDDYCRKFNIKSDQYIPSYWNLCEYEGHIYALPTTPASTALHYNKRLFREAGLDPEKPPKTIEELSEMADKLTKRGKDGKIEISGFLPTEPGWWNFGWVYPFGGDLWNGKDTITTDRPENIRAYEWLQSFPKKYGSSEMQSFRSGFGNFASPQNAFMAEKVAMEIQGVWMANFIKLYNPKLEWGAVPFPYPKDRPDLANWTYVDCDLLVIPTGARHPDEAFEFMRFIQSREGMEMLCLGQKKHSPLRDVSAEFYAKHPNPYIKLFYDLAWSKNSFSPPQVGIWPEFESELSATYEEINLLKITPLEAMQRVKARIQPKLTAYLAALRRRNEAER